MAGFNAPSTIYWGTIKGSYVVDGVPRLIYDLNGTLGYWLYTPTRQTYMGSYLAPTAYDYTWTPLSQSQLSTLATGGRSGGGGGASDLAARERINDVFYDYLGRPATSTEMSRALAGQWSQDHIVRYIMSLSEWEGSVGWRRLAASIQDIWNRMVGYTPVPVSYLRVWINGRYSTDQVAEAIRQAPEYKGGNEYNSARISFEQRWDELMGFAMAPQDVNAMINAVESGWTMVQWEDYIREHVEYRRGYEYQSKLFGTVSILRDMWGAGQVSQLMAADPNFIENRVWAEVGMDADPVIIREWARSQPEYLSGPAAASTRENLIETYRTILRRDPTPEELNADILAGTTPEQLIARLRSTEEYQQYFAGRPGWMSEAEFVARKESYRATVRYFYGDDYELSNEQVVYFIEHGITPSELLDRFRASEEAVATLVNMNYYGQAIGRTFTTQDAIRYIMKDEGYGEIAAAIIEGQNRRAFDEVFRAYTGRMPTIQDYEFLRNNFISPQEYAARTSAKERADRDFQEIDRMFMRVFGHHADYDKYLNAVSGGEGSGAYLALIQAAEELDRYNTVYKLYSGHDASPTQLMEWSGLGTPEALEKMLHTQELVARNGAEIMAVWNRYFQGTGAPTLTDEDLFTVLGQYEGWGAIQARLDAAMAHKERQDRYRINALSNPYALAYTALTEFGGPKLPTLVRPT